MMRLRDNSVSLSGFNHHAAKANHVLCENLIQNIPGILNNQTQMTKVKTALEQKQVWGVTINLQKFSMASPDNTIKDVEKYVEPPAPREMKKE